MPASPAIGPTDSHATEGAYAPPLLFTLHPLPLTDSAFVHAAALGHALQRRGLEGMSGDLGGTDTTVSGRSCT